MSDEIVKCILCGKDCVQNHVISDDVVEGYKSRQTPLNGYIVVNADLVVLWRDRIVCRICWKNRKTEATAELWRRAQSTIKVRLPSFKAEVQQKRRELRLAEKNLAELEKAVESKNPGLKPYRYYR